MSEPKPLLYSEYINVAAILSAQTLPERLTHGQDGWPLGGHVGTSNQWPEEWPHEELLFIVTHQAFELWFKQMLHDLDDVLRDANAIAAKHGCKIRPVDLAQRDTTDAPALRRRLGEYPKTQKVIEQVLSTDEWEHQWSQELHEPGVLPLDFQTFTLELAWFDDATLERFARRVDRCTRILRHITGAFDVLATMPPEDFLAFRSRLAPASGFGSSQFRAIEITLGLGEMHARKLDPDAPMSLHRHLPTVEVNDLVTRLASPSLRDLVYGLVNAKDLRTNSAQAHLRADTVMAANLRSLHNDAVAARAQGDGRDFVENHLHARWRGVDAILSHVENIQLVWMYAMGNARPALRTLIERCLEIDDALKTWRTAHISLVERIIGARPGTGGGGLPYLHNTLRNSRAFPCLWEFRSILVPM